MMKLNVYEEVVVDAQCSQCKLWSDETGCTYDGGDPHPLEDCNLFEENKKKKSTA